MYIERYNSWWSTTFFHLRVGSMQEWEERQDVKSDKSLWKTEAFQTRLTAMLGKLPITTTKTGTSQAFWFVRYMNHGDGLDFYVWVICNLISDKSKKVVTLRPLLRVTNTTPTHQNPKSRGVNHRLAVLWVFFFAPPARPGRLLFFDPAVLNGVAVVVGVG